MGNAVLEELYRRLTDESIPARLLEDEKALTVLLEPPTTDFDIYGDVFFNRFGGDKEDDGLLVASFEVCDITDEPDEVHANLGIALSLMNASLTAGGYLISVSEQEDADTNEPSSVKLMYRLSLPVGFVKNDSWLAKEAYECVLTSAAVLKVTSGALLDFARGRMSREDFLKLI
ncbi:MAG: hypothetical protein K6E91_09175 [Butyrivibrio sp.]|nr:hypothetical protein [Butyrivibrio sp.]